MIRKAFMMSLTANAEAEYERRHNPIWPELEYVFKTHGVSDYSIFLLPGRGLLFGYAVAESETQWSAIAETPECRRWWRYMSDLMHHDDCGAPIATELEEVFHLA
jgi:L-rhamnose mutarotase